MTTFIWTAAIIWGLEAVVNILILATGTMPSYKPVTKAIDVVIGIGLVIWAAVILAQA